MLLGADWCTVRSALLLGGSRLAGADFAGVRAARMRTSAAARGEGARSPAEMGRGLLVGRLFYPFSSPRQCS